MIYQVKGISGYVWGMRGCVRVCTGVHRCAWVCAGVSGSVWVCAGVSGSVWVCQGVRDELSEYLLETRFLTSANYNPHPLRIFFYSLLFIIYLGKLLSKYLLNYGLHYC